MSPEAAKTDKTDPVTKLVSDSPSLFAGVLLVLALVCGLAAAFYGKPAFFAPSAVPAEDGSLTVAPINPNRPAHIVYALGGVLGFLSCILLAVWVFNPTTTRRPDEKARIGLLAFGTLFGGTVMLFGAMLFGVNYDNVSKWLSDGDTKQATSVLVPLVVILIGATLCFVCSQPARAEERNNPTIRRLVYGSNLALTAMMLLFALLIANLFISLRLPNKLDTTESGFYTLTDDSKKYLAMLDQPVVAYTNLPEEGNRFVRDARRLLDACQEANPARFQVKYLSPVANKDQLTQLKTKYPGYDFDSGWVLLATGDNEARSAFIRLNDMIGSEGGDQRTRPTETFAGESKVMREVLFLADNKAKPVVYFTQGHGELSFSNAAEPEQAVRAGRTANALKALLEKNYVDVKVWTPEIKDPKVPDDATAVIVADPRSTLPPEFAMALQRYMMLPRPGGSKGKLIVMTSPFPNIDGKGCADTGLEGLMQAFGIQLGKGYLLTIPMQELSYNQFVGVPFPKTLESGNSIAGAMAETPVVLRDARTIEPLPKSPDAPSPMTVDPLIATYPSDRYTWIDSDPPTDPKKQFEAIAKDKDLMQKFRLSNRSRIIAAIASEESVPRMVVFGSGSAFADSRERNDYSRVELVAASLDWLRDRPKLAVVNKTYQTYTLPKTASSFRLFWLPFFLILTTISIAGLGVWIVRRR
ncbi:hypothetical protein BH11PLA2_BH11PLA2_04420 [soil metagenome]